MVDALGARVDAGQLTALRPASGSLTPTPVSVTLPLFTTTNEYVTVCRAAVSVFGNPVLLNVIDGKAVAVTVSESKSVTVAPVGGVPRTVAVLLIAPASMSACVVT